MDTVVEDAFGYKSGNTLVVPVGHAGKFILSAHCRWENAAVTNPTFMIAVNSVVVVRDAPLVATASPAFFEQHCVTPWTCADGDIIKMQARHDSGVARNISAVTAGGTDPTGPIIEMWRIQ
jgi:hypothetical protein